MLQKMTNVPSTNVTYGGASCNRIIKPLLLLKKYKWKYTLNYLLKPVLCRRDQEPI